jgi:hypothetical protein
MPERIETDLALTINGLSIAWYELEES